jgi:adenylate kinase
MRLLIVGPPGAGKGTQAARLAAHYGIPAISTGDIFRSNIANRTPLGVKVDQIVKSGGYVPDEVTNDLVRSRLEEPDCEPGFLLDGYPRTRAQVDELDQMLAAHGVALDHVVQLVVDDEVVVQRLIERAAKENRADDTPETIRRRQEIYVEETAPLIDVYAGRGIVVPVDGLGSVDEVADRVVAALDAADGDDGDDGMADGDDGAVVGAALEA